VVISTETLTVKFTRKTARSFGRKGGTSTFRRHGREHMQAIGRRGIAATCERHFGGSRRAMLDDLVQRGLATLDPFPANGV
jgi:general stress protein YciG